MACRLRPNPKAKADTCIWPGWKHRDCGVSMSKIDALASRIDAIEDASGLVELSDGTRFKPSSGLRLMRQALLFERENGREPELSDFPEEDADLLKQWAKLPTPKPRLAKMTADFARRIVAKP